MSRARRLLAVVALCIAAFFEAGAVSWGATSTCDSSAALYPSPSASPAGAGTPAACVLQLQQSGPGYDLLELGLALLVFVGAATFVMQWRRSR